MISRYSLPQMDALWSDTNRLQVMLDVELLVLDAQASLGLVPHRAVQAIRRKVRLNLAQIQHREARTHHDVIAFIEHLESQVGPNGRYVHLGLTSSDVLDTALAVLLRQATTLLLNDLEALLEAIAQQARRHKKTLMIGRTHGVHAEPTTFGLKLATFYDEFGRLYEHLEAAKEQIGVGKISGAVGSFANIDPRIEDRVCRKLGLRPAAISTQIVSRDRHASYATTLALMGCSLERLATEIRHLQRTEVREAAEPFGAHQKGSSAMPHKQNPIVCERVTGLSRLLRGYALAAMENVALWHERDISHSSVERVILPDATIVLDYMLQTMTQVIAGLVVDAQRMRANLESTRGVVYSGQVLLGLMCAGLSRTQAYALVQRCALKAWQGNDSFEKFLLDDPQIRRHLTAERIHRCLDPRRHLVHVDRIFKRVGLS